MNKEVMTKNEYDFAFNRIKQTLKKEDVENIYGVVSFYDMVEYGKKGLKELREVVEPKSILAKEINSENSTNSFKDKYHTRVNSKTSYVYDTCTSTIEIISSINDKQIILTKDKKNELIDINPKDSETLSLVMRHLFTILKMFKIIEKYSYFFGGIDNKNNCYIQVDPFSFYFIRLYYNSYGEIKTEIRLRSQFNTEQTFFGKKALKQILEENKEQLLKKIPFDLNRDFRGVADSHIPVLAQREYFKEKEKNNHLLKKKILK